MPEKILSVNRGELANSYFTDMCQSMNIVFKLTAAEAPSSKDLVEWNTLIIAEMLDKVVEESNININLALPWCINAKQTYMASPHYNWLWDKIKNFMNKPPAYQGRKN